MRVSEQIARGELLPSSAPYLVGYTWQLPEGETIWEEADENGEIVSLGYCSSAIYSYDSEPLPLGGSYDEERSEEQIQGWIEAIERLFFRRAKRADT